MAEPSTAAAIELPRVFRLAELERDKSLLEPPPTLIPYLAWEGRLTLFAAQEKAGKSTLAGQAVAAMTRGDDFLGAPTRRGSALWLILDEPMPDYVARMVHHRADGDLAMCVEEAISWEAWEGVFDVYQPNLVVIDTLAEWAGPQVDDFNSAKHWQPVLASLRKLFRARKCAGLLLHHTTRDGSRYADSRQVGAAMDAIVEMSIDSEDQTVRDIRVRARRVGYQRFKVRYSDNRYELEASDFVPLREQIRRLIENRPGIGKAEIRRVMRGDNRKVDEALGELIRQGIVEDVGSGQKREYYLARREVQVDMSGAARGSDAPKQAGGDAGHGRVTLWGSNGSALGSDAPNTPDSEGQQGAATGQQPDQARAGPGENPSAPPARSSKVEATGSNPVAGPLAPEGGQMDPAANSAQQAQHPDRGPGLESDIPFFDDFEEDEA